MFPTELAPMSDPERGALEAQHVTFFRFVDALQAALYLGLLVGLAAAAAAKFAPASLAFGPRTLFGKGVAAGLVAVTLTLLHHVLVTRRHERERLELIERDLRQGEVELLVLPTVRSVVLVTSVAFDDDEPEAESGAELEVVQQGFLDFGAGTLVLDLGDEIEDGDPPRLRGRDVRLARGPASKGFLPPRCSGEPLDVHAVLDARRDDELAEPAWWPLHGEVLSCRAQDVRAALVGREPERRRFAWPDLPPPRG